MRLDQLLPLLLLQITVILALSRGVAMLFNRFRQPQVVGEMVAGIMLGPSLFGWLAEAAATHGWTSGNLAVALFPPPSISYLGVLSQVGVIFFLFLIGLELDPKLIKSRGHAAVVISHVSIVAPFVLGAVLALFLYPRLFNAGPRTHFTPVALFLGAAMSVTAFPVLARILTERNLHKTKVGAVAITCAAVDDVTAWCILAFVVAVAKNDPQKGVMPAVWTAVFAATYVLVMFFVVRPFLRRLQETHERQGKLSQNIIALIILLTLISAYTTERIGIHALFGAFLLGAIMPKGTHFVRALAEKLEDFTVVFLLPIFFAYTGLQTRIGLLNNVELWGITLLIIAVACAGKFGGSTLAARACGLPWRESSTIGILMNTRGLMELVILNVGRELGVITPAVFAMMVIMALVTTALTTPILHFVYPRRLFDLEYPSDVAVPRKVRGSFSILIPVADPRSGGPLLRLAEQLAGRSAEAGSRIYALHLRRPIDREAYRAGLDEQAATAAASAAESQDASLRPLLESAIASGVAVEPISFISRDIPGDIARVTRERGADLVLTGFHRSVLGRKLLGGAVHRVLMGAPADVGVFVDRGFTGAGKVLVPYLGSRHDRLALELASRLAARAARG